MKFPNPLRNRIRRDAEIAALTTDFNAAAQSADVGEKLTRYRDLEARCEGLLRHIDDKSTKVMAPGMFGGIALALDGGATANLLLVGSGFAMALSSMVVVDGLAADARESATALNNQTQAAIKEILHSVAMEDIARSGRFDDVMNSFPDLKNKFILAASRDKVLKIEARIPPRRPPGFNM